MVNQRLRDGQKVIFLFFYTISSAASKNDLLNDPTMDGHINFSYKPLRGLDSRGRSSRLFDPFASSEYMRQAQAACDEDEYPICLALFADGVNVKKNLEAHPIFCTLMNYDASRQKFSTKGHGIGIS